MTVAQRLLTEAYPRPYALFVAEVFCTEVGQVRTSEWRLNHTVRTQVLPVPGKGRPFLSWEVFCTEALKIRRFSRRTVSVLEGFPDLKILLKNSECSSRFSSEFGDGFPQTAPIVDSTIINDLLNSTLVCFRMVSRIREQYRLVSSFFTDQKRIFILLVRICLSRIILFANVDLFVKSGLARRQCGLASRQCGLARRQSGLDRQCGLRWSNLSFTPSPQGKTDSAYTSTFSKLEENKTEHQESKSDVSEQPNTYGVKEGKINIRSQKGHKQVDTNIADGTSLEHSPQSVLLHQDSERSQNYHNGVLMQFMSLEIIPLILKEVKNLEIKFISVASEDTTNAIKYPNFHFTKLQMPDKKTFTYMVTSKSKKLN
ncbi:hypothetical protein ACS0TY_008790 [Phlomoides rotata]